MQESDNTPAVDFREIPIHSGNGNVSDAFELFARDFFAALGFRIVEEPARGADGGRDLVIEELLRGTFTVEPIRWIVSAKHFAHSGESVRPAHELDPKGRVDAAQAQGFIGFYSTVPSAGLRDRLRALTSMKYRIFDRAAIEQHVLSAELEDLFRRYFPMSWARRRAAAEERRLIVAAETDPFCTDDVPIDLSSLLRIDGATMRFTEPELERIVTAAVIATGVRASRLDVLERFVSFHPAVWRYLLLLFRDDPPEPKRLAATIARVRNPFVLRNLISLAGMLQLDACATPICAQTLDCARYDRQLRDRGYTFGIRSFTDVARRALSGFGSAILPILDEHRTIAKARRRWKAKGVFDDARANIVRGSSA